MTHPRDNSPAEWDERYAGSAQVWSGRPNGALLAETSDLPPGRALDVGCGEGADAVWLAQHGWSVTGLDVSTVAVERAAAHARDAGVEATWVGTGLVEAALAPGSFDLVSACYPALLRTPDHAAERALLDAVAPGGTLLVVHHADIDRARALEHGFDPDQIVGLAEVTALLDDRWRVESAERRLRDTPAGPGGMHTHDEVLRATRLA